MVKGRLSQAWGVPRHRRANCKRGDDETMGNISPAAIWLADVYRRTASGASINEPVLRLGGLDFYDLADRAGFRWR
jgi:hypothetical protein